MTEGTELQSNDGAQEAPKEEPREVGEKAAEPREAPEAAKRVEDATVAPEAVIEREGSYELSETIEKAFVGVVEATATGRASFPPVPPSSERPEPNGIGEPGRRYAEEFLEVPGEGGLQVSRAAGAPLSEGDEPAGAREAGEIPSKIADDSGSERELVMENLDEEDGGEEQGVEVVFEPHEPNVVKDGLEPDGAMRDGERDGYQGDHAAEGIDDPGGKSKVDLDPRDGLSGGTGLPGPGNIPGQEGLFPWEDRADLRSAAAPGSDSRLANKPADGTDPVAKAADDTDPVDQKPIPLVEDAPATGLSDQGDEAGVLPGVISGQVMGPEIQDSSQNVEIEGKGVVLGLGNWMRNRKTPDPEGTDSTGATPSGNDPMEQYLWNLILPGTGQPLDLKGSMMQPEGEESWAERPLPPITLEQALSANLDPYVNWGEGGGGLSTGKTVPESELKLKKKDLPDPDPPKPV